MKIIIVDDNVAIQEIIRDILGADGHNVRLAGTVSEAVYKIGDFQPDVIFVDSKVDGEDGLRVLSRVREEYPSLMIRAVLIKGRDELAPTDNPFVRASIDKPFKSSEIVEALRLVEAEIAQDAAMAQGGRGDGKKRGGKARLFGKRQKAEPPPEGALQDNGVVFGSSYVVFEEGREGVYYLTGLFDPEKYEIMVVTADKAKAVKERFSYGDMEVVPLSTTGKAGSLGIRNLGTMTSRIRLFVEGNMRPVVIFDTFGEIIAANGLNQSVLMLQQLIEGRSKPCTFAVSVDPSTLTDKDRRLFLHSMKQYTHEE